MSARTEKSNAKRLIDLKAALKKAKAADWLELKALAALWGVSKQRFVNKRDEMGDFPDPKVDGNRFLYPATDTIKAMIAYIERHHDDDDARHAETDRLLGKAAPKLTSGDGRLGIADTVRVNNLRSDVEIDEREQGFWIHVDDAARLWGEIFSEMSKLLSDPSKLIDPHGTLPAKARAEYDANGRKALLKFHEKIKARVTPGGRISRAKGKN